jgi:hypothetical protein
VRTTAAAAETELQYDVYKKAPFQGLFYDVKYISNIIHSTREPMGRYIPAAEYFEKGAGANGYIFGFDPVCNYALRCYYSCDLCTTQKVAPSAW